jgi:hypothetical protein
LTAVARLLAIPNWNGFLTGINGMGKVERFYQELMKKAKLNWLKVAKP